MVGQARNAITHRSTKKPYGAIRDAHCALRGLEIMLISKNLCALIIAGATLFPLVSNADKDVSSKLVDVEIERYQKILFLKRTPTLRDYYYWYGNGAEGEKDLALQECGRNGWSSSVDDLACRKYLSEREKTPDETPSLYIGWLRPFLSEHQNNLKFHVQKVTLKRESGVIAHNIIDATVNGHKLQLMQIALPEDSRETLGRLFITRIDNIDVNQLLSESLGPSKK
jgi:hypothetical protein